MTHPLTLIDGPENSACFRGIVRKKPFLPPMPIYAACNRIHDDRDEVSQASRGYAGEEYPDCKRRATGIHIKRRSRAHERSRMEEVESFWAKRTKEGRS